MRIGSRTKLRGVLLVPVIMIGAVIWQRHNAHQEALNDALIAAVQGRNASQAEMLLREGANPNAHSHAAAPPRTGMRAVFASVTGLFDPLRGRLPALTLAAAHNDTGMVSLLLAYHADPNISDNLKATPLHWVSGKREQTPGGVSLLKALIDSGARIDIADERGMTPLMCAAMSGNVANAQLLIARGASLRAHDKRGQTPLRYAASFRQGTMAAYLKSAGAAN